MSEMVLSLPFSVISATLKANKQHFSLIFLSSLFLIDIEFFDKAKNQSDNFSLISKTNHVFLNMIKNG